MFIERRKEEGVPYHEKQLQRNYRSTQTIVNASQVVIEKNVETGHRSSRKRIFSSNEKGDKVTIVSVDDIRNEVQFVANKIEDLQQSGVRYVELYLILTCSLREIAVLCRVRRNILADFILELKARKIKVAKLHGKSLADKVVAKEVIAYVSLAVNRYDNEAFKTVYNCPKVCYRWLR